MLPFHQWKEQQVKKDSLEHNVFKHYRERSWYHKAYGAYCNKYKQPFLQDGFWFQWNESSQTFMNIPAPK